MLEASLNGAFEKHMVGVDAVSVNKNSRHRVFRPKETLEELLDLLPQTAYLAGPGDDAFDAEAQFFIKLGRNIKFWRAATNVLRLYGTDVLAARVVDRQQNVSVICSSLPPGAADYVDRWQELELRFATRAPEAIREAERVIDHFMFTADRAVSWR